MADNELRYRLILKDGTILDDCRCGYSDRSLWCFLRNISFYEAFRYFSSPEVFETVVFEMEDDYFIDRFTYSGIENIVSVIQREDEVNVRLEGYQIEKVSEHIVKESDEDHAAIRNTDQNEP